MPVPRDLLDEIELELAAVHRSLVYDGTRTAMLERLQELACRVADELGRPITVFDFLGSAATDDERRRRLVLVRQLRSDPHDRGGSCK